MLLKTGLNAGAGVCHEHIAQCTGYMSMQAALAKSGIVPSNQPVSTDDFTEALTNAFGYAPILHCHHNNGNSYIEEVRDKS